MSNNFIIDIYENYIFDEISLNYQIQNNFMFSINTNETNLFNQNILDVIFYDFLDIYDSNIMETVQNESLNSFKTEEKKPNVKLCDNEKIVTQNMVEEKDNCAICLSIFELGQKITDIECKHSFHTLCLSEWVKYKSDCPVCRKNVKTIDEIPNE